jgi:hypothetical protein
MSKYSDFNRWKVQIINIHKWMTILYELNKLIFNSRNFNTTPFVLFSSGHCIFCPFIYDFWLPIWYLRFTTSDYPFGIINFFLHKSHSTLQWVIYKLVDIYFNVRINNYRQTSRKEFSTFGHEIFLPLTHTRIQWYSKQKNAFKCKITLFSHLSGFQL